jgi:hypothetical protein
MYQGMGDGVGWFLLVIFAPIVFTAVFMLGFFPLLWLLKRQSSPNARWGLCLIPAGVLLAMNGVPGLLGMGALLFMTISVYIDTSRKLVDSQDLKTFLRGNKPVVHIPLVDTPVVNRFKDDKPVGNSLIDAPPVMGKPHVDQPSQVHVRAGALAGYDMPLWERLECDELKPLSVTEGVEDGYSYKVIDMRHRGFGRRGDNGATVVTTFFVVTIPETIKGRFVTWQPEGWDVSVDKRFVYMARVQERIRPREWRYLLQQGIKVVDSLQTTGEGGAQAKNARTYRPRGSGLVLNTLHAWLFLAFGVAMFVYGLAFMFGILDYRTGCRKGATEAHCLDTVHVYSVPSALREGGKFAVGGVFLIWGAYHFRGQARRRQRNDAHVQGDQ